MCGLDIPSDPAVIVGLERADDAGVYRISDDLAIIQTVDFFTPIVDDPFQFGRIAAANALSDVYAMGGEPKTAMNLVAFPLKTMDLSILRKVIEGGLDKLREAGVALVGGHSVEDDELKYGLSVTGFVHPDKVLTKKTLQEGDKLVLTKPLGTGIVNTAIKGGMASGELIERVTSIMAELNRKAADVMKNFPVHACTDVTGFGLIGHLAEMVLGSGHGVRLEAGQIPVIARGDRIRRDGDGPRRGLQEQGIPAAHDGLFRKRRRDPAGHPVRSPDVGGITDRRGRLSSGRPRKRTQTQRGRSRRRHRGDRYRAPGKDRRRVERPFDACFYRPDRFRIRPFCVCARQGASTRRCKSSTDPAGGTVSRTARVSIARWNLKEAAGKALARRTETGYKAFAAG